MELFEKIKKYITKKRSEKKQEEEKTVRLLFDGVRNSDLNTVKSVFEKKENVNLMQFLQNKIIDDYYYAFDCVCKFISDNKIVIKHDPEQKIPLFELNKVNLLDALIFISSLPEGINSTHDFLLEKSQEDQKRKLIIKEDKLNYYNEISFIISCFQAILLKKNEGQDEKCEISLDFFEDKKINIQKLLNKKMGNYPCVVEHIVQVFDSIATISQKFACRKNFFKKELKQESVRSFLFNLFEKITGEKAEVSKIMPIPVSAKNSSLSVSCH